MTCHFCGTKDAHHYIGGGAWVCFKAWLALCGLGKGCK